GPSRGRAGRPASSPTRIATMFRRIWKMWLQRFSARAARRHAPKPGWRIARRPQVEWLEDRITPAGNITIAVGANGSGTLDAFLTGSGGTIFPGDGGTGLGPPSTRAPPAIAHPKNINLTPPNRDA